MTGLEQMREQNAFPGFLMLLIILAIWQCYESWTTGSCGDPDNFSRETVVDASTPRQRLCRVPYIKVEEDVYKQIFYQCGGKDYYDFHNRLQRLWNESQGERPLWGRRDSPVPHDANIFVWGNSQTRQVVEALLCQYQEDIVDSYLPLEDEYGRQDLRGNFLGWAQLEFSSPRPDRKHKVTIFWVINTWHSYTGDQWQHVIEDYVLQNITEAAPCSSSGSRKKSIKKLADFDAVLLGKFNRMSTGANTQDGFYRRTYPYKERYPNLIDFDAEVPQPVNISRRFKGPVLGVLPFAPLSNGTVRRFRGATENGAVEKNLSNLVIMDGRRYMNVLGECVGTSHYGVSECVNQTEGHRCSGAYGSHADTMVWEIAETLHLLFSDES